MTLEARGIFERLVAGLGKSAFSLDGAGEGTDLRIGMEVEFIPIWSDDGLRVPITSATGPSSLATLRTHASRVGWAESVSYAGCPRFDVGSGGALAFEPGGQIELSTGPMNSIATLAGEFNRLVPPLVGSAEEAGISFVTRGVDPHGRLEDTALQVQSERYQRMQAHLDRHGAFGRRMMRQTAAIHLNMDLGSRPLERWHAANRMAPVLTAMFANSSIYMDELVGHRSFRAHQWRKLDPLRTGLVLGDDPASEYAHMGLEAPALFIGPPDEPAEAFRKWVEAGTATQADWARHVSTLFPEVRARGYLEIRAIDALHPKHFVVPAVIVCGALYDEEACRAVTETLPEPSLTILETAGEYGLRDPVLARASTDLVRIALDGIQRLPAGYADDRSLEATLSFVDRLTLKGLDPASLQNGALSGV